MLQVANIEKSYGKQVLFDGVGFTINPRERVGLVGRNGHGKSTLFRMILGEARQDSGTITVPSGYTIGHLSQHIHFTEDTVIQEACLALPENEDHIDETYKAEAILHGLGFTNDDFYRSPSSLSGGYQVRLNLAKVLVSEPNLLLLDEPTNYLDIVSVRWLTQFLRAWRNELIIITHDREFMDSVTTHTMIIHRCKMRKVPGNTQKLYDQILLEEEIHEKTRQNDDKKRKEVEQFINRFRAQATKASAVQSRIKALAKHGRLDKLGEIKSLDFKFRSAPFEAKWLMTVEDLSFSFSEDGPKLIDSLSFAVGKNDRIAVIGKNGKGKTTLLNLLAGELTPSRGDIRPHPNTKIAYFGQTNINRLRNDNTALQEIMDAHPDNAHGASRAKRRHKTPPEYEDRLLRSDQYQPPAERQYRAPGNHGRASGQRPWCIPRHLRAHDVRRRQRAQEGERALGRGKEPSTARQAPDLSSQHADPRRAHKPPGHGVH